MSESTFPIIVGQHQQTLGGCIADGEARLVDCFGGRWTCALPWLTTVDDLLAAFFVNDERRTMWLITVDQLWIADVSGASARVLWHEELRRMWLIDMDHWGAHVLAVDQRGELVFISTKLNAATKRCAVWLFEHGPADLAFTTAGVDQLLTEQYFSSTADGRRTLTIDGPCVDEFLRTNGLPTGGEPIDSDQLIAAVLPEAADEPADVDVVHLHSDALKCVYAELVDTGMNPRDLRIDGDELCVSIDGQVHRMRALIALHAWWFARVESGWWVGCRKFRSAGLVEDTVAGGGLVNAWRSFRNEPLVGGCSADELGWLTLDNRRAEGPVIPVDANADREAAAATDALCMVTDSALIDLVNHHVHTVGIMVHDATTPLASVDVDGGGVLSVRIGESQDSLINGHHQLCVNLVYTTPQEQRLLSTTNVYPMPREGMLIWTAGIYGHTPNWTQEHAVVVPGVGAVLLHEYTHVLLLRDGAVECVRTPVANAVCARLLVVGDQVHLAAWPSDGVGGLWRLDGSVWVHIYPLGAAPAVKPGDWVRAWAAGRTVVYVNADGRWALNVDALEQFTPPDDLRLDGLRTVCGHPLCVDGADVHLLDERLRRVLSTTAPGDVLRVGMRGDAFHAVYVDAQGFTRLADLAWV